MILSRRGAALCAAAASLSVAATAPAAMAAQSAAAAPATGGTVLPPVLGDLLATLLGSTQIVQLNAVTAALSGGAAPSADTLAPLTAILGPLPEALRSQLSSLLGSIAATPGLPAPLSSVLDSRARRALKRSSKVRFVVSTFSSGGKVSKRTITVKKAKAKTHTVKK